MMRPNVLPVPADFSNMAAVNYGAAGDISTAEFSFLLMQLSIELTHFVGPVAPALVEEKAALLGFRVGAFPQDQIADLVGLLEKEIPDALTRKSFTSRVLVMEL